VLAEDAFRNREFQKAADYYEQGLAIAPLWPQGQFNAAVLEGELETYSQAVLHMKRYLELSPDAADAQSAREQMIIWQSKLPD
jgi:tetratricopeptide (TPR) repeat protein